MNPFNPKNIIRVYDAATSKGYNCYVVFSTQDPKVKKWEVLGFDKLVRKDELKRTMTFTFENREECKKFKKYLYWKIWRIEL